MNSYILALYIRLFSLFTGLSEFVHLKRNKLLCRRYQAKLSHDNELINFVYCRHKLVPKPMPTTRSQAAMSASDPDVSASIRSPYRLKKVQGRRDHFESMRLNAARYLQASSSSEASEPQEKLSSFIKEFEHTCTRLDRACDELYADAIEEVTDQASSDCNLLLKC